MSIDHGFKIMDDRLSHWSTLLEKWYECFNKCYEYTKTVPALSKEETHVGILSEAAWQNGWVGFQEMSRNRDRRVKFDEHCDLYICDRLGTVEDYIECKKTRLNKNNKILKLLNQACKESQSLDLDDASERARRIGVVFADFEFPGTDEHDIERSIRVKFDSVATILCDAMAWSFPKELRCYRDKNPDTGSVIILPGTMLLAKFVGNQSIIER